MLPAILIVAIGIAFIQLITVVIQLVAAVWMAVLTYLGPALWLLIRAALLVLMFILLAIEIVFISLKTIIFGGMLTLMQGIMDIEVDFKIILATQYALDSLVGYLDYELNGSSLKTESWITWIYWEYFDLYVPWIVDKTINNDSTMQETKKNVMTGETVETTYEVQPKPLLEASNPMLFEHGFTNTTLDYDQFQFIVRFHDKNFEEPDSNFGVKLYIVAPNGTTLEPVQMGTVEQTPDYANNSGVLYGYSFDASNYEEGLWHYYFSTKDYSTDNVTVYPGNKYLIGPDTSQSPKFLGSGRITTSNASYYDPEGWKSDEFTFYVNWWDMVNGTSPSNVSLCLIPAQIEEGSGVSNNKGIKKFLMSPVSGTPNYTNPVEFSVSVNFTTLGYANSDIGTFYHYYEAKTSNGTSVFGLSHDGFNVSYVEGPIVRPIDEYSIELEISSSNTESSFMTSDSYTHYYIKLYDYQAHGFSDTPKIVFTDSENEETCFEMASFENSSDGKIQEYYYTLKGEQLKAGSYSVDLNLEYDSEEVILYPQEAEKLRSIYVFTLLQDMIQQLDTTIVRLGHIPTISLAAISTLALMSKKDWFLASSIVVSTYFIVDSLRTMFTLIDNGETGQLLGFSLACMLIFIALQVTSGDKADRIDKIVKSQFNYFLVLSMVFDGCAGILSLFLPDTLTILSDVMYFASNIFTLIPLLYIELNAAIALNLCSVAVKKFGNTDCTNIFSACIEIYKFYMISLAIVGFTAFMCNLGTDIYQMIRW